MLSILEVLNKSAVFLEERGVKDGRLSSEWIIAEQLGLKRLDLFLQFERPLDEQELVGIRQGVKRRANHEPLQHILGYVEFGGLKLKTDKRALIPRPETEYLLDLLLTRYLNASPESILDLGTGTGALGLSLASEFSDARVTLVDVSADALLLAKENAKENELSDRIEFLESNWFDQVEGTYQLIVSNPPYLTDEEMESAEVEVIRYEPELALHGGGDGLRDLNLIMEKSLGYLVDGGVLALETGIAQHESLKALGAELGYSMVESVKDLSHRDRFVICVK